MSTPSQYQRSMWYPVAAVSLAMVSFIVIKTARDGVYFAETDGLSSLPLAYVWISLSATIAAMVHMKVMNHFGARRARTGVLAVLGMAFIASSPLLAFGHGALLSGFFIAVPVAFAAIFAVSWLLAGDVLDGATKPTLAKAYARIGAASTAGGALGGVLAKVLAGFLAPSGLVIVGGGLLICIALLTRVAHARHPIPAPRDPEFSDDAAAPGEVGVAPDDARALFRNRVVRSLILVSSLGTLAALFVEFQFYAAVTYSGDAKPAFFGDFYTVLNGVALLLQLVAAPALQARLGITGTLLILPVTLLGATGTASILVAGWTRSLLKVTEAGMKSAVHRSAWEQSFLSLPRNKRGLAKTLVDGAAARVAEGLGAVVLYVWVISNPGNGDLTWLSWVIAALVVAWIVATLRLKVTASEGYEPAARLPDS